MSFLYVISRYVTMIQPWSVTTAESGTTSIVKEWWWVLVRIISNKQLHWFCGVCNVKIFGISHDLKAAQELVVQLEDLTLKQNVKIAYLENSIADNGYANGHGMEGEIKDLSRNIDVLMKLFLLSRALMKIKEHTTEQHTLIRLRGIYLLSNLINQQLRLVRKRKKLLNC